MDRVEKHLRHLGRKSPDLLQPPVSDADLQRWSAEFPFAFTEELRAVYSWRDGTRADAGDLLENLHFFPGFVLLSLEDARRHYMERKDGAQWQENWFPLFADEAGDYYVVPCEAARVESTAVIGFVHGEPEQIAEYQSVAAMMATLDAAFAAGVFFVDGDDSLEIDDDRYKRVARRFNPGISEWQD